MNSVSIIFPHQLFANNPCLRKDTKVLLVEEYLFFNQYKFHKQKLVFHRASMRFLMATKPYISGSNYLMKMSNYPKGEWQQVWDALFWRFMHVHRDFFNRNPRLGMLVKSFDSMDIRKRNMLLQVAEDYIASL